MSAKKKASSKPPKKEAPAAEASEAPPVDPKRKRTIIACGGCGGLFVIAAIVGLIALTSWDQKDSRLYKEKPLPSNVAYIGRWVSDDVVAARIDTFAITGDRIACDFAIRNDSEQDFTVLAIGRTIIGPALDARLGEIKIAPELMDGDLPMKITDDENVLGLQLAFGGQWLMIEPGEAAGEAPQPQPFTLKPGETKRARYRPKAHQMLMPASALRIAVALDGDPSLHAFYFMRKSAGIGGWFEKKVETAVTNAP